MLKEFAILGVEDLLSSSFVVSGNRAWNPFVDGGVAFSKTGVLLLLNPNVETQQTIHSSALAAFSTFTHARGRLASALSSPSPTIGAS